MKGSLEIISCNLPINLLIFPFKDIWIVLCMKKSYGIKEHFRSIYIYYFLQSLTLFLFNQNIHNIQLSVVLISTPLL